MKKLSNELYYCSIEDLKNGNCELGMEINGQDLLNMDLENALEILNKNGLIKNEEIIIPSGLEITTINEFGGATQYNFNNGFIIVDLCLD